MSCANDRNQEHDAVYHLTSRVAHRVYFLQDEERNDFIEMMRRCAEFSGIKLIGWCVMTNHFHIMVYLPTRVEVDNEEVLRRYGVLKGKVALDAFIGWIYEESMLGKEGEENIVKAFNKLRARMYDIGEFMKTLKQWFTQEYNKRNSHVGTLWETAYHDKPVPMLHGDLTKVLAYIHLNPIRAAVTDKFDGYLWSSLNAAVRGDPIAIEGLKFVYGNEASISEILAVHHVIMNDLLEAEKQRRAMEIARKRAAGYQMPSDSLTSEAYIAQAQAHLEKVIQAGVTLAADAAVYKKSAEKRQDVEGRILEVVRINPTATAKDIADKVGVPYSTAHKYISGMQRNGLIIRKNRRAPWEICEIYK